MNSDPIRFTVNRCSECPFCVDQAEGVGRLDAITCLHCVLAEKRLAGPDRSYPKKPPPWCPLLASGEVQVVMPRKETAPRCEAKPVIATPRKCSLFHGHAGLCTDGRVAWARV